jgi:hypothetical protein
MASEVGKLEEQALKRKERLKALRERQQDTTSESQPAEEQLSLPK